MPILDMTANLMELSNEVQEKLQQDFKNIGLQLTKFNFQNFSLPEELEKAFDKSASLGMLKNNMDTYMLKAQADALGDAAKNTGAAGGAMGAGMGMGMGIGMGNMFGGMMNGNNQMNKSQADNQGGDKIQCSKCGASMKASAKFCPDCGNPNGTTCPKCKAVVKSSAKFCPDCGASMAATCPKCNSSVKAGAKFCPECGEKI